MWEEASPRVIAGRPVGTKPMDTRICGVRVKVVKKSYFLIHSWWWGRWAKIVVREDFLRIPMAMQFACFHHEAHHVNARHVLERLKRIHWWLYRPADMIALCCEQELEADRAAADAGYGPELLRLLEAVESQRVANGDPHPFLQPRNTDRISHLRVYVEKNPKSRII